MQAGRELAEAVVELALDVAGGEREHGSPEIAKHAADAAQHGPPRAPQRRTLWKISSRPNSGRKFVASMKRLPESVTGYLR